MDQPISSAGSGPPSSPMATLSWRRSVLAWACAWGPTSATCASHPTRRGTRFEPVPRTCSIAFDAGPQGVRTGGPTGPPMTRPRTGAKQPWAGSRLQKPISRRPAGDALRRRQDGVDVEAVVAVELGQRSGLAEVLDAQRAHAVAAHTAKPGQRLGIGVRHGDDGRIARQLRQQVLDVRSHLAPALLARALSRVPAR